MKRLELTPRVPPADNRGYGRGVFQAHCNLAGAVRLFACTADNEYLGEIVADGTRVTEDTAIEWLWNMLDALDPVCGPGLTVIR